MVRVLEHGERPPGYPSDAPEDTDGRRLMVQTSGTGAWTSHVRTDGDPLAVWKSNDLMQIRRADSQATGNYCFECSAWYCATHSPIDEVLEPGGAPMYDWWWESVCPKGHKRTFERW